MKISVSILLSIALVIEILVTIIGVVLYMQGPTPYVMTLNETGSETFTRDSIWVYLPIWFPTGTIHAKFALNTTISVLSNSTQPGLAIYLLNETQLTHWQEYKTDYILTRSHPNYNFTMQVEPNDYFLAINTTHFEANSTVQTLTEMKVTFQNFNYDRVWPNLYLVFAGVVAANLTIIFMKKRHMFGKIDSFFKRRFVANASFLEKKAYTEYA